jgi:hypothetical protein
MLEVALALIVASRLNTVFANGFPAQAASLEWL